MTTTLVQPKADIKLSSKISRRIEDIPDSDWNAVYPDVLESYHFFRALDDSHLNDFTLYYILIYEGKKPVGAAPCFLMNYSLDTTIQGPLKLVTSFLQKISPEMLNLRAMICGSPMGEGRIGILAHPELVLDEISKALRHIAREENASVIAFKDFDHSSRNLLEPLFRQGFCRFESLPNTDKVINFSNFEDYLKSLSYATRYDLKRKFKKVDGRISIELEITNKLNGSLDEAYALYRQMSVKHDIVFEIVPKEFFVQISEKMPEETKFFLWRIEGKLVAFALSLVSKDCFMDYYLGLDYDFAHQHHLYFVRFRDMMSWCIKNGIQKYEMGTTNYDPKKRLDFRFVPMDIYAKHRNALLNFFLKISGRFLEPKRFDPVLQRMEKSKVAPAKSLGWGILSLVLLNEVFDALGQILMKKGLPADISFTSIHELLRFMWQGAASGLVWIGVSMHAFNFFLWMLILSRLELSTAMLLTSFSYLILPFMSIYLLHEKLSLLRLAGMVAIMMGVYCVSRTTEENQK